MFHQSHGIEVNVTDKDQVCLYAKLMLDFTVSYEGANKTVGVYLQQMLFDTLVCFWDVLT